MRMIIESQNLLDVDGTPLEKNYCIYAMPESKFLPSLWIMIGIQVFLIGLCWLLPLSQLCCAKAAEKMKCLYVLSETHKELVEAGERRNFWKYLKVASIVLVVCLSAMTAIVIVTLKTVDF